LSSFNLFKVFIGSGVAEVIKKQIDLKIELKKENKNTKQKQKQKQNEGIEEEKDKYDIQSFSRLVDALGCF